MRHWHIITGEYPPKSGGVADYTELVARALHSGGDEVDVWCPAAADGPDGMPADVRVHRIARPFRFAGLLRLDRELNRAAAPRRILVQWVPHAFGWRSMNVAFCFWLWRRAALSGDCVELMVHEAMLELRGPLRQRLAAAVHRLMISVLLASTRRVWVSTPAWIPYLKPWTFGRRVCFEWLAVPSTIPVNHRPNEVAALRKAICGDLPLVGHFGTYGRHVASCLEPIVARILSAPCAAHLLLIGRASDVFRAKLLKANTAWADRITATSELSAAATSLHLQACDVLTQPYPDGVTTRRSSLMAGLAHGSAIVTNRGALSEEMWESNDAVVLVDAGDADAAAQAVLDLLGDRARRAALGRRAQELYDERLGLSHVVAALQDRAAHHAPLCAAK